MKIVAPIGSGRKCGNTDNLTEKIQKYLVELESKTVTFEKIYTC